MADGIAQKTVIAGRGGFHDPNQRAVGRWVDLQNGIIGVQFGHPGFIELENGLGGFAGNPLGLGVAQGVEVEFHAFRMTVAAGQ